MTSFDWQVAASLTGAALALAMIWVDRRRRRKIIIYPEKE